MGEAPGSSWHLRPLPLPQPKPCKSPRGKRATGWGPQEQFQALPELLALLAELGEITQKKPLTERAPGLQLLRGDSHPVLVLGGTEQILLYIYVRLILSFHIW